jgi:hypothetical protein
MNATSTFATPPIARSGFSTHTARQQAAWSLGDHAVTGTTTERAALFGAFRLLPAQQLLPDGLPLVGRSVATQFTQPAHAWLRCVASRTMRPDRGRPSFERRLRRSSG